MILPICNNSSAFVDGPIDALRTGAGWVSSARLLLDKNMKRTSLVVAGIAGAGVLLLWPSSSCAQTNAAPTPQIIAVPAPGQPPGPEGPQAVRRPRIQGLPMASRAIMELNQVKAQMEGSTNDFGGHRESCIAACDKAIEELSAVITASGGRPPRPFVRPVRPLPPGAPAQPTPVQQTTPPYQPPPPLKPATPTYQPPPPQ
jgi:hypothetical protein